MNYTNLIVTGVGSTCLAIFGLVALVWLVALAISRREERRK